LDNRIVEQIKKAGVVGAGGAGFPTHFKIETSADWVIVNGAECEPLLRVDQQLMAKYPAAIVEGLMAVLNVTKASRGIIALKGKYADAVKSLEQKIENKPIDLFILDDFYPAGDEHVMVFEVLKRIVPEGGLPLKVGCVVVNVETLYNISKALQETPVTKTFLTVTGDVAKPFTAELPIGLSIKECLNLAGERDFNGKAVIEGGPLMGKIVEDLTGAITKTTKGLIVLPENHPLVNLKRLNFNYQLKRTKAACIQCRLCTEVCPRHLLGHNLEPHKIMRALNYLETDDEVYRASLLCSECGACEYICPMGLSPCQINACLKQKLGEKGLKPKESLRAVFVDKMRDFKKVSSKRLIIRMGLSKFDVPAPLIRPQVTPLRVQISLRQHLGVPARALVKVGDRVKINDLLAVGVEGKLGANVHASINGEISAVEPKIVIEAETR